MCRSHDYRQTSTYAALTKTFNNNNNNNNEMQLENTGSKKITLKYSVYTKIPPQGLEEKTQNVWNAYLTASKFRTCS